jgi:hypothetical protein
MTAENAGLEIRVSELERQVNHVLPFKIDAVGFGVGLVYQDTLAIRSTLDGHTARLDGIDTRLDRQAAQLDRMGAHLDEHTIALGRHGEMLGRHGEMLEEILRRLPPGPAN